MFFFTLIKIPFTLIKMQKFKPYSIIIDVIKQTLNPKRRNVIL